MKKALKVILYVCAAVVIILVAAGLISRDKIVIPEGYAGSYINVDGEQIRYLQKGSGRDVLLIHGLPGCIEDWTPVINRLSRNYRVTAFDRPGHGFSSAAHTDYTLAFNAKIALELIRELKLKNVLVAGHSYGGGIVLSMAVQNPPEIGAYVFIAGVSYPELESDPLYGLIRIPLLGRGFAVLTSQLMGPGMVKEGEMQAFHPNENLMPSDFLKVHSRIYLQPKVIVTLAREAGTMNSNLNTLIPRYGKISSPFYILHGDGDLLVPVADSKKLHTVIKRSSLVILAKTGHQVQFANPGAVVKAVNESFRK